MVHGIPKYGYFDLSSRVTICPPGFGPHGFESGDTGCSAGAAGAAAAAAECVAIRRARVARIVC